MTQTDIRTDRPTNGDASHLKTQNTSFLSENGRLTPIYQQKSSCVTNTVPIVHLITVVQY